MCFPIFRAKNLARLISFVSKIILVSIDVNEAYEDPFTLEGSWPYIAVLHANLEEAAALLGMRSSLRQGPRNDALLEDYIDPVIGVALVIITLGSNGCFVATSEKTTFERLMVKGIISKKVGVSIYNSIPRASKDI
eukprot:UC4_evm4s1456